MEALLAILCGLLSSLIAPSLEESKGEHITLSTRCDPPVVQPGGWIDLVVDYSIDPGWHTVSPNSSGGPRTSFDLKVPRGFTLSKQVLSPPGLVVQDATFGQVEQLSGRGTFRRRIQVPNRGSSDTGRLDGSLTVTVCDFERCLPPQTLAVHGSFAVDAKGSRGPLFEDDLHLSTVEQEKLSATGLVTRAWVDATSGMPGEVAFVVVDVISSTKPGQTVPEVLPDGPCYGFWYLPSYRTEHRHAAVQYGAAIGSFSEVIPIRILNDVKESEVQIHVAIKGNEQQIMTLKLPIAR